VVLLLAGFLAIKGVALWALARVFGITRRQRGLFAILLSQGGEFAFVVFAAAQNEKLLDRETGGMLTMVVALSMAATPVLLAVYDRLIGSLAARQKREADTIDEDLGGGGSNCRFRPFRTDHWPSVVCQRHSGSSP
jgi:glutathione-regulated potassium-efflux system ancillary protein KefC